MKTIPISEPLIGNEEKMAVLAVLESKQLAQGAITKQFEDTFAEFCGARFAVATSSGTTALQTALFAHSIGAGDEVITSPFTFIATTNAILSTNAKPVFVDIDAATFNIDPALIEAKITSCTKAIMPIHLYGQPCEMNAIGEIARKHNLIVIEDAAQSVGAEYGGRKVGTFGTGCFSFYATKNLMTAEGGMLTTNDEQIAERARMIRSHGMRQRYYHEMLGFNFRMTDIQAAIGLAQFAKLAGFTASRIANATFLTNQLQSHLQTPIVRDDCKHVFHQYTIRVPAHRDEFIQRLTARGIGTGIYYPIPIHQQPFYKRMGYQDELPVSELASQQVISLPVHPALSQEDLQRIVHEVKATCSELV